MIENKIGIIGSGSWATAIVMMLLEKADRTVGWWVRNDDIRRTLAAEQRNPAHLVEARLDTLRTLLTADLMEVVDRSSDLILAIPSAFIESVLVRIPADALRGKNIISAVKGVIPKCNLTVSQYLTDNMGVDPARIAVISGPTHAEEVCQRRPTFLTIAASNLALADQVADYFRCAYVHTSVTPDLGGVETACLVKNIYAIGAGLVQGLGYGDNLTAVGVVASMKEMVDLLDTFKPLPNRDFKHYCFAGDLMVTCWSSHSRNRALGVAVAQGRTPEQVFASSGSVAEGYYSVANLVSHIDELGLRGRFPIVESVYRVLYEGADPRAEIDFLVGNVFDNPRPVPFDIVPHRNPAAQ